MSGLAPLTSPDCDLRDFPFMALDVVRVRDSDMAADPDAEVFRAAVLSWCVAWHQVPAGSLPDDDAAIARLIGMGRDVRGWKKLREAGALRGFILCSDGRLYHKVVSEKAAEAWERKLAQRDRTEKARTARLLQNRKPSVTESVVSVATPSKGQGEDRDRETSSLRSEGAKARPDDPIWGKSLIPDWIPVEAWKGYVEMRRRIRAPLTSRAVILTIGKLEALRRDGEDVGAVLDASIQNSWRGVFPVKQNGGRNVGDHKKPAQQSFASSISRAFSERNQQGEDFHGGGGAEFIPPSNPANQERTDHETPRLGGPAADAA